METINLKFNFDNVVYENPETVEEIVIEVEEDDMVEEVTVEGEEVETQEDDNIEDDDGSEMTVEGLEVELEVDYDDDVDEVLSDLEDVQGPEVSTEASSEEPTQEELFQVLAENDFFNLFGTPENDIPFWEKPITDWIEDRYGVDRITGVNFADPQLGPGKFDLLLDYPDPTGEFTFNTPDGELFVLGDENKPYYTSEDNIYTAGFTTGDLSGVNQFGSSGVERGGSDLIIQTPGEVALSGFTDGSWEAANFGDYDAWLTQMSLTDTI